MSKNQSCSCERYTLFPIKGFSLAMDTSEMDNRLPSPQQMANAAMPSLVSVDIPPDVEPRPDLLAARTTFTAPADGYVWAQGRRSAQITSDFSSVSIHLLDATGQNVLGETGFFYTPGYQGAHLPVSTGAQPLPDDGAGRLFGQAGGRPPPLPWPTAPAHIPRPRRRDACPASP